MTMLPDFDKLSETDKEHFWQRDREQVSQFIWRCEELKVGHVLLRALLEGDVKVTGYKGVEPMLSANEAKAGRKL